MTRAAPAVAGVPAPDPVDQDAPAGRPGVGGVGVSCAGVGCIGVGGLRPDPRADPVQAVRVRLHLVRGGMQRVVQEFVKILSWRWLTVVTGSHY